MINKENLQDVHCWHRQTGKTDKKIHNFPRLFQPGRTHVFCNDKIRDAPPRLWKSHAAVPFLQYRQALYFMPVMMRQKRFRCHTFSDIMYEGRKTYD